MPGSDGQHGSADTHARHAGGLPPTARTLGLRRRLLLAFLLVALLPLVALFLAVYGQTRQDTLATATDTLERISGAQQRRLNLELGRLTDLLTLVSSRTQMRISLRRYVADGDPAHLELVERILRDALDPMGDLAGIWVRDPGGELVSTVTAEARYPASRPRPPPEAGSRPLTLVHDPTGAPRLWLTAPLTLKTERIGSIHILVSMDELFAVLEDFPQARIGGRTFLLLRNGAGDLQALDGARKNDPSLQAAVAAGRISLRDSEGVAKPLRVANYLVQIAPLDFGLGHVLVAVDVGTVKTLLWQQTRLLLATAALALLLSGLMALTLARMIARPLEALTRATRSFPQDQTPVLVHERSWGELNELARSFNYAMTVISRRTEALRREVEARRMSQQKLADLANTDTLTGLVNRRHFMDALGEMLEHPDRGSGHGALLYIDLDGFKPVNDHLGHEAGDIVLQVVAGRLGHLVRERDLAARIGGDEFALLLAAGDGDGFDPDAVAHRTREQLTLPIAVKGHMVRVGCSLGVVWLVAGETPQEALNRADAAMYQEKAAHHAEVASWR